MRAALRDKFEHPETIIDDLPALEISDGYDLDRLERMILRRVARDYFLLLETDTDPDD